MQPVPFQGFQSKSNAGYASLVGSTPEAKDVGLWSYHATHNHF